MVIYLVDTHSWIEYFAGSKPGWILRNLFNHKDNKFVTMECNLAELKGFCLRENIDFKKMYSIIKKNSIILPVLHDLWLEAGEIKYQMRKKVTDFGLIDAILIAKQNELKCQIISGDRHFKNVKNVVYIGN